MHSRQLACTIISPALQGEDGRARVRPSFGDGNRAMDIDESSALISDFKCSPVVRIWETLALVACVGFPAS